MRTAQGTVHKWWPTPLVVGAWSPAQLALARETLPDAAGATSCAAPAALLEPIHERWRALGMAPVLPPPTLATIEWWRTGYAQGLMQGTGARWRVMGLLAVTGTVAAPHLRSGSISLHDPRAGAGNVEAPGQPFGRPLTLPLAVGNFAIFPAWLRYTVFPVVAGEARLLLQADLEVNPTC